jgi:D-amino peptidase
MHAMAGTPDGVLSHTVSGQAWQNLRFNGTLVGETGINAALCGHWGVPVLLVTGDRAVCAEAKALLGEGLTTVEVKEGLGRFSARMKTPARARELIEEGARQALSDPKAVAPYDPGRPAEIEIDFTSPDRLREYANRKGVEVTGPRSIVVRGDDWWSAWSGFFF